MKPAVLVLTIAMVALIGCFHVQYVNLHPGLTSPPHTPSQIDHNPPNGWQHFFVYGWFPTEKVIDAEALCGGTEHIDRIETERTFVQGLIGTFAGYQINIYSPYTGRVVCDHSSPRK